jgi:hypothetical protein
MEALSITDSSRKSFVNHVFSSTEEGKAEILNVLQYSFMGILPIILLNKSIQRFVPEADPEKSSLEVLVEILIQLVVMFCGIVLIHRTITYFPTYSGFKYESLNLSTVILAFLMIVLSLQTKLGLKVNILADRVYELWNGPDKKASRSGVRVSQPLSGHMPSQADTMDSSSLQMDMFPPAPVASSKPHRNETGYDMMRTVGGSSGMDSYMGPMAANGVLGGSFGTKF